MAVMRLVVCALVFTIGLISTAYAGQAQAPPTSTAPPQAPPASDPKDPTYKETVVVSASKTEEQLVNAPVTMTVIGAKAIEASASTNYGDLLRSVPGLNVTQISARDVNVTSRAATGTLATSQLAVLDGRSLYLDFFGFIMWDFMPVNMTEIKRIEVIRGPASAIWGANATSGVINVITKTPREMQGTTATIGAGWFGRDATGNGASSTASAGSLFYLSGTHARAVNDRLAFKISAGGYSSDPMARPVGLIPNGLAGNTTKYPDYANAGTSQPKFDARVDYDLKDGAALQFSGGAGGTSGIMHTGIGPFDVAKGSVLGYAKMNYTRRAFRFQVFTNILDGNAKNLLTVDQAGKPINFVFNTKTTDIEAGDTRTIGTKQAITYGGNVRFNQFQLTIAPGETSRAEAGAYLQDEIALSPMFRLVAAARLDKFSTIGSPVFSPRVAFLMKPKPDQTIRVSYNRAFRAPSMINNNLDVTIANPLPLGLLHPAFGSQVFMVPTAALGNKDLKEQHIDAFEVSYTANVRDRATISGAWYVTKLGDEILFTQTGTWTTPPPGFPGLGPVPPSALWGALLARGIVFPSSYTYLNLGEETNKGVELGVDGVVSKTVTAFANYSYQTEPTANFALTETNLPARHRYNAGVSFAGTRAFGTLSVSHAGSAFWQDVLDDRYHGRTDPYTTVNLTVGARWGAGKYAASLKVTNLANQQIQQHVFGDIVRRQAVAELRVQFK